MVFESVVVAILKKYIGKYLKNFDTKNFSLGLWSGEAILCDLELKEEALLEFDLPIAINAGYIGKLSLNIPWTAIYTKPVVVKIEDVFILIGPQAEKPYNKEKEERCSNVIKQKQLKILEKSKIQDALPVTNADENDTLTEKLTAQIIKNLQIFISKIHVRYEDLTTIPKSPFAFGVTLYGLTAETATSDWLPTVVDGSARQIYKLIKMDSFSIYWNTDVTFLMKDNQNWKMLMKSQISKTDQMELKHEFLLRPLSFTTRLSIDQNAKVKMELPKFVMNVLLKELALELSKPQFEGIISLVDSIELMRVNQAYRKFRPVCKVKDDPRAWWRYAFNCYREYQYLPWTWKRIKKHRQLCNEYMECYLEKLKAKYLQQRKNFKTYSLEAKEFENQLDIANILISRKQAEIEFESDKASGRIKSATDLSAKESVGWLEWLGVTATVSDDDSDDDDNPKREKEISMSALSETEKEELYRAISYVDDKTHPVYSKKYVRSVLGLHLDYCTVTLKQDKQKSIATFTMDHLYTELNERPGSDGIGFKVEIEKIGIIGEKNNIDILKPKSGKKKILKFDAQLNPVGVNADYLVTLQLEPLFVFYDKRLASSLRKFFKVKNEDKLRELEEAASETMEDISKASRAGIEYAITRNKLIYFNISMMAPTIILPHQNNIMSENEKVFHLYLGDVKVVTNLQTDLREQSIREATESDLEAMFYHQTNIKLSNIHFSLGLLNEDISSPLHECYIIPPLNIDVNLYQSLKSGYSNFPDFKITGSLPLFELYITEDTLVHTYQMLNYFFPPTSLATAASSIRGSLKSHSSKQRRCSSTMSKNELSNLQDILSLQNRSSKDIRDVTAVASGLSDVTIEVNKDQPIKEDSLYDSSIALFDRTKLSAFFELSQVKISYSMPINGTDEEFLCLSVHKINLQIEQHIWDISIKAKLSSFQLKDLVHEDYFSKEHYMVSSLKNEDLIQFHLIQADSEGPEFRRKFQQTESKINISIGSVQMQLELSTLQQIIKTSNFISSKLEALQLGEELVTPSIQKQLLATIVEEDEDIEAKKSLHIVEDFVMDKIAMDVVFSMKSIATSLTTKSMLIATFSASEMTVQFIYCDPYTEVTASLNGIEIMDQSSIKILEATSDQLISTKITMYEKVCRDNILPDTKISFNFGKLNICYSVHFFSKIIEFYGQLGLEQQRITASGSMHAMVAPLDNFTKYKVDIIINAPLISIPINPSVESYFTLDFGKIVLKNNLVKEEGTIYDILQIKIADISLTGWLKKVKLHDILSPVQLNSTIKRSLNQSAMQLTADVDLPKCFVELYYSDLINMISIYNEAVEKLLPTPDGTLVISEAPVNQDEGTVLNIKANLQELLLEVYTKDTSDSNEESLFLRLSTHSLDFDYLQQSTNITVNASLNTLNVKEYFTADDTMNGFDLFDSSNDTDMLSVSYCYDGSKKLQNFTVEFTEALINLDATSLLELKKYYTNVFKILDNVVTSPSPSPVDLVATSHQSLVNVQSDSTNNIEVQLGELNVFCYNDNMAAAKFQAKGLTILLNSKKDKLNVKARLTSLHVRDLNKKTLYPEIVFLQDDNFMLMEFTQTKKMINEISSTQMCQINSLWLRLGRIHIVFLYKFIQQILDCMKPITDVPTSDCQVDLKQPGVEQPEDLPMVLELDIDVSAPLIKIPEASTSNQYMLADLGRLIVNNTLEVTDNKIVDQIKAVATNAKVLISCNNECSKEVGVTNDLNASVVVSRFVKPSSNKKKVQVEVKPILIWLSDVQIQFLMQLFQSNFAEDATQETVVDAETNITPQLVEESEEDQADGSDSPPPEYYYDINLHINLIELHVLTTQLLKEKCLVLPEDTVDICKISASKLLMNILMNDEELVLEMKISELTADDTRPYSNAVYKRILGMCRTNTLADDTSSVFKTSSDHLFAKPSTHNDQQINLKYMSKTTKQRVELILCNTKLNMNVDFLKDFYGFIYNTFVYTDEETDDTPMSKKISNYSSSVLKEKQTPSTAVLYKFNFDLSLNNTTLILLQSHCLTNTPALISRVKSNMSYESTNTTSIFDIPTCMLEILFGDYPMLKNTAKPLLQPCHLKCHLSVDKTMQVDMKLDQMKFSLSPSILTTLIAIADNMTQIQSTKVKKVSVVKDHIEWGPCSISTEDVLKLESPKAISKEPVFKFDEHVKQKLVIAFDLIEITLGNDFQGVVIPLIMAKFSTRAQLTDWSYLLKFEGDLTLEMSYYNDILGTYEPLIEPRLSNDYVDPYELNIRMFYGESEKLDFSSKTMISENKRSVVDSTDAPVDEVDASFEGEQQALFIVINSDDEMQLTLTCKSMAILQSLSQGWSMASLRNPLKTELAAPLFFKSMLRVAATVFIDNSLTASVCDKASLITVQNKETRKQFGSHNELGVSTSIVTKRSSSIRERGSLALIKPKHLLDTSNFSYSTSAMDSIGRQSSVWEDNKEESKHFIDIHVEGFDVLRNISVKTCGTFAYTLLPTKNGFAYRLVVKVKIKNGQRKISLGSHWMVENKLHSAIELTFDGGVLVINAKSNNSFPLDNTTVHNIGVTIDKKYKTVDEIQVENITNDDKTFYLQCVATPNETNQNKYIKVSTSNYLCTQKNQIPTSIQLFEFLPPMHIQNLLPYAINYQVKVTNGDETSLTELPAGGTNDVLDIKLKDDEEFFNLKIIYHDSNGVLHEGTKDVNVNKKNNAQIKMVSLVAKSEFTIEVSCQIRNGSISIICYTLVWILNKTCLDLQFKNQDSSVYELTKDNYDKPMLVTYSNIKKAKGCLCLKGSTSWTDTFSLSAIGDEFTLLCKDEEGRGYPLHVDIQLSNMTTTHIISISPKYFIFNHTQLPLVYSEEILPPKEFTINQNECVPVWLHNEDSKLLIKEEDAAYIGSAVPFNRKYIFAKRLCNSRTLTIDCNHIGDRFIMNITEYEEGSIPLRVDNYCTDISMCLKQKNTEGVIHVKEFLPNKSQYYNWTDLTKLHEVGILINAGTDGQQEIPIDITMDSDGKAEIPLFQNDVTDGSVRSSQSKCCSCSCFPWSHPQSIDDEDNRQLLDNTDVASVTHVYWISYLEGTQRVLAFTKNSLVAKKLQKNSDVEYVTLEMFLSLQGIGLSLVNSEPMEIAYATVTGGTSVWEMELQNNKWEILNVDLSTFLEDSYKNSVLKANFENKYQVDLQEMMMLKPKKCKIRRSCDPALWVQYSQSKNNTSMHLQIHRLQVDSQQYDVSFPTVLYPTPLPTRIIKRNGIKPFVEMSVVFSSAEDVTVIKYFKLLLQEVNLKIDRDILRGVLSLIQRSKKETDLGYLFLLDQKLIGEDFNNSINLLVNSQSSNLLLEYLHLSPIKIHLSFSLEGRLSSSKSSEEELLEWLISTVGIHFTDISDAEIKLAFFELKNAFITQDMLIADATKHYTLQAIKQFHVLVLGLDVLGNPYGLITEYGRGFKDLFYEPYLGSVAGPHQFAEGLAYGIKSLLGHTIGGTVGAASLITEQLGQMVAALTFDSEYKRRRRREMATNPTGIGHGLAIGGKQFVLGFVFGISGLVTKPVQGARRDGLEGFFKGVGKGIMGLIVKPTGGVIDLVTSSLDGVRRFAEQGGEDIVCRIRLPRVTFPNQNIEIYSSEQAYGFGVLRTIRSKQPIDGRYQDYVAIPDEKPTLLLFTTQMVVHAVQHKFFDYWQVEWMMAYQLLDYVEKNATDVVFRLKKSRDMDQLSSHSYILPCHAHTVAKLISDKCALYLHDYHTAMS